MHAKRLLVVLTLGMCLLFAAGCAQQTKPTSSEDNTKPGQTEQAASTKNNRYQPRSPRQHHFFLARGGTLAFRRRDVAACGRPAGGHDR